jgi:ADP-ribosylation factor GTPase-activating protein 1
MIILLSIQVGGNDKAKAFFNSQPDVQRGMSLQDKYNTKAAALYRDKVNKTIYHHCTTACFLFL